MATDPLPPRFIAPLILVPLALLLWLERRLPLRRWIEGGSIRLGRNLSMAALGAVTIQMVEMPLVLPLSALVERREWGVLHQVPLPYWMELALALILLDYTLYVWHVLNHRVPLLWRFHLVHHVDLDLDVSNGLRFHFGELALSVFWRSGQILLIGVSPLSLSVWQVALLISVMFHHSNLRLPIGVERWINRLIVTPRMHGIHHSMVREEMNSNWSSGLTLWDRLHGTLRLNVPQEEITIGLPAYRDPGGLTFFKLLMLPFLSQRQPWRMPGGGQPARDPSPVASKYLVA